MVTKQDIARQIVAICEDLGATIPDDVLEAAQEVPPEPEAEADPGKEAEPMGQTIKPMRKHLNMGIVTYKGTRYLKSACDQLWFLEDARLITDANYPNLCGWCKEANSGK